MVSTSFWPHYQNYVKDNCLPDGESNLKQQLANLNQMKRDLEYYQEIFQIQIENQCPYCNGTGKKNKV